MSNFGAIIIAAAILIGSFGIYSGLAGVAGSIDFAAKMYVRKS